MKELNLILRNIFAGILFIAWIAGTVLAKGFWLTFLSICFPFYPWYLIIEKIMLTYNILI